VRFLTSLLYLLTVVLRLAVIIVPPLLMRPMLGSNLAMSFFVPLLWITVTLVILFFKEIREMTPRNATYENELPNKVSAMDLDSWRTGRPFADDTKSSIQSDRHF
jgi:hypothetical protein